MFIISTITETFGSFWGKPTPPPLTQEQEARVELIWKQFQHQGAPFTKQEVSAAISLEGRVKPGRYSKAEVAKLTSGFLNRPIGVGEQSEIYLLAKKEGRQLGEGKEKRVYEGWEAFRSNLRPIADLTVRSNLKGALQEISFTRQVDSQYVMKILTAHEYRAPHLVGRQTVDQKLFIAQERMDGTLMALAKDPKTTVSERFDALIHTAKALRDLHRKGIVHNDLHWENALFRWVSDRLEVKITDLGEATKLDKEGQARDDYHLGVLIARVFYEDARFRFPEVPGLEKKVTALLEEILSTDVEHPPSTEEILQKLEVLAAEFQG